MTGLLIPIMFFAKMITPISTDVSVWQQRTDKLSAGKVCLAEVKLSSSV